MNDGQGSDVPGDDEEHVVTAVSMMLRVGKSDEGEVLVQFAGPVSLISMGAVEAVDMALSILSVAHEILKGRSQH